MENNRLIIERFDTQTAKDKQTLGIMFVVNEKNIIVFKCFTLELPDLNNLARKSNIPKGIYDVEKRNSPKYGNHFHILNVPNRDFILIHNGNYFNQILGCVLVGADLVDLNKDGLLDVTSSTDTLKKLNGFLPNKFKVTIV